MQGPGYVPQRRPSTGTLVALRVTFVGIALLSIGFLAWTALLRLAVVTQKARDWAAFALATALDIAAIAFLAADPGEEITTWRGELGMVLLLATLFAVIAYYLTFDIRHYQQSAFVTYPPAQPTQPAYGYPPRTGPSPYTSAPRQTPMSAPPLTPAPQPPVAQPQIPQRPAPARIDQVRAELDELSDYLRKHDGGPGGSNGSGGSQGSGGSHGSGGSFEGGR